MTLNLVRAPVRLDLALRQLTQPLYQVIVSVGNANDDDADDDGKFIIVDDHEDVDDGNDTVTSVSAVFTVATVAANYDKADDIITC